MGLIIDQSPFSGPESNLNPGTNEEGRIIPPPPETGVEVSIRTMASDLALMGQNNAGGKRPAAERIVIATKESYVKDPTKEDETNWAIWIVVVLGAGIALFLAGYFLLPAIFQK